MFAVSRYPPFRWLFVTNVFNTCYGSIANLFFIYWFRAYAIS